MTAPFSAIVAHGGGPTTVLNASLAGVIDACREERGIGTLYGAHFGVAGLLTGDWIDLTAADSAGIRQSPGSVLGSSRQKVEPGEMESLVASFRARGIGYFFHTGGNGSMHTAEAIQQVAASLYPELRIIGIPKTVDNDLNGTDHTPGYGSAVRFYAQALRDIGLDNRALPSPVTFVEIIGRNAGWVTCGTALARLYEEDAPHLIYTPERPPAIERVCEDVERTVQRIGRAVVAVCEGLRDPSGEPFGADVDRPGSRKHELASNLGHTLAREVNRRTGVRTRSEKPGLLGRACSFSVSPVDSEEAYRCGRAAVRAAVEGQTGRMVSLRRASQNPYHCDTTTVPLAKAVGERLIPSEWIHPAGNDVTKEFLNYVRPLAGEIPRHVRI